MVVNGDSNENSIIYLFLASIVKGSGLSFSDRRKYLKRSDNKEKKNIIKQKPIYTSLFFHMIRTCICLHMILIGSKHIDGTVSHNVKLNSEECLAELSDKLWTYVLFHSKIHLTVAHFLRFLVESNKKFWLRNNLEISKSHNQMQGSWFPQWALRTR